MDDLMKINESQEEQESQNQETDQECGEQEDEEDEFNDAEDQQDSTEDETLIQTEEEIREERVRRSGRTQKQPERYQNYVML